MGRDLVGGRQILDSALNSLVERLVRRMVQASSSDSLLPNAVLLPETDQNTLRRLPPGFEQIRRDTLARTDLMIARDREALSVSRQFYFTGELEFVEYAINSEIFFYQNRQVVPASAGSRPLQPGIPRRDGLVVPPSLWIDLFDVRVVA